MSLEHLGVPEYKKILKTKKIEMKQKCDDDIMPKGIRAS